MHVLQQKIAQCRMKKLAIVTFFATFTVGATKFEALLCRSRFSFEYIKKSIGTVVACAISLYLYCYMCFMFLNTKYVYLGLCIYVIPKICETEI